MKTCIVIPMKDPRQSKQRLSGVLDSQQRQTLALTLFRQTLRFLNRHFTGTPVLVVTASERVAEIARSYGAEVQMEQPPSRSQGEPLCGPDLRTEGLNGAAALAAEWSVRRGFDSQLLLPADIAELSEAEIRRLLEHPREVPSVLICPADDGGTNALLTTPPNVIPFQFGPRSSRAHLAAALKRSIPAALLRLEKLTFDLDTPEDLQLWTRKLAVPPTAATGRLRQGAQDQHRYPHPDREINQLQGVN